MIPASAVASPVAVTRARRLPSPLLIVPAMTRLPGSFFTGRDSPVIIASSTSVCPSVTSPSAGMLAPGRTRNRSAARSCATGTVSVRPPSRMRSAVSGSSRASSSSAPVAWRTLRISSQCPSSMIVISVASSQKKSAPMGRKTVATL